MKYPVANISFEGQGWNPYSLVLDEGKEAFTKRVIDDGHYQKGEDGMGYTEGQRRAIAGKAFDQAQAYVTKYPLPQDEATPPPPPPAENTDPKDKDKKTK